MGANSKDRRPDHDLLKPPKEMTSPCAIDGASFCTLPSMEGLENGAKAQTT
jgi:hypothetical protein